MTNRSKIYFATKWAERELKKLQYDLLQNRNIFDDFFHVPIPGSADMSRLKLLADLESPNITYTDLNGRCSWKIPEDLLPIIIKCD